MNRRFLSILLALCMMLSMVPVMGVSVSAAATAVYVSSNGNDYNNNGTYNSPYATISKAYSMATDGGTIYVMSDLTVSSQLVFSTNKAVTIRTTDVNNTGTAYTGNTVMVKRSATTLVEPFTITAGTVTFTNITLDGNTTGTQNGKPAPWLDYTGRSFMRVAGTGTVVLDSDATVQNISSQNVSNTQYGPAGLGGIVVESTLYIKEGSRISNISAAYGAIRVYPVSTTSNVAYVEMSGGIIEYCDSFGEAFKEGSTIYIFQVQSNKQANFKMTGGTIENCGLQSFDRCYGTIYLHPQNTTGSSFIMTGGTIKNNKSGTVGGIYIANGNVQMSGDAQVYDNVDASGNKANVSLKTGQTIILTGSLSDKANIGITSEVMPTAGQADVVLAKGNGTYVPSESDARAFSSDKATTAGVMLKSNQVVMSNEAKAQEITVSGKVSDYAGGSNTLSDITVGLYDAADTNFARALGSAVTSANGTYSMPVTVKKGNYVVRVAEKADAYSDSTTTVTIDTTSASNVNLTLVKYSKASVVLNKPIFNNNQTGYSFKSATINNFTGVKSITFSITKGTTVQYVPTFLTPTSKLESIDGDTRTATYVFESGITVAQAEEFIRGIVFNYVAGAEISVTVDNNLNKLPDGAKITEFAHPDGTDHYYMYVPFISNSLLSWTDSYNAAKTYRYMGMIGYLATITSSSEDIVLDNISMAGGWSAGSRYTGVNDGATAPTGTLDAYFKWACGPEAGENYYYYSSSTDKHAVAGSYNGFKDITEPNNYNGYSQPISTGNYEWCMQIHHLQNNIYTWNDLSNTVGTNSSGIPYVKGYFVEFSKYNGGMDSSYASDKTAVGTFNLATDGGVEEITTVTLNAPVYGAGNQSVFSFDNATITNISKIYTLTIKLDNYTNVLSKPSAPIPSNELSNIAGSTNTITYQFKDGITQAEAQSFLRGLKFRYGGLRTSSTTNVSITVDGNKTNLPQGASITEFNGHYYMYVPSNLISWTDAYNLSKSYTYMGLKGYLATITSQQEDAILTNISTISAWSAGTRYVNADGTKLADPTSVTALSKGTNYYYWACGPEAGTIYYNSISPTPTPGAGYTGHNGAYNNWGANPRQPDAYDGLEVCMQVNWPFDTGANGIMRWNDLPNEGLPNISLVKGYFVEFSDYDGGRIDGFIQSASGKSTVPITVEKGDVFNTVKDGVTYYVDTVLTAFDRNITKITVNGTTVSGGYILPGNRNMPYTVVATDLEGNTATMTVTMKTIASISEPIKSLTVSNVQMSHKDSILAVKAALKAIDQTTASTAQKSEISSAIQNCQNLYFALFNATATAVNGTNGWYKNGIGSIVLTAPDGFQISTNNTGAWTDSITIDSTDGASKKATYYLKETSTGDISGAKTFSYKVDTVAPTGTITIRNNQFKSFLNTITFGLFFKSSVDVSISASDTLSTPVTVSYQKIKDGETYQENGTWTTGSLFSVTANEKFSVYAKLVDNAGNTAIINSNGVVVYTDSTQSTANITFTKTSTADVTAKVNLNGNTVKEIKNGANVIATENYTVAADGTITFKASYLNKLTVGSYALTVSYNPMGENYVAGTYNQAPANTSLTLVIQAKSMSESGGVSAAAVTITPDRMVYTGKAFAPTVTVKDETTTLTNSKDYDLSWTTNMTAVGEKTLTVTFKGDYSGSVTKKANVTNAAITDTTNKTQSAVFNNTAKTVTAPTATTVNNQAVTVKYSTDSGNTYTDDTVPSFINKGEYTVYYQLSALNHDAVTGEITFTVSAATDNEITNLVLRGWTFGETANTPTANAKYGTIGYTYSDSEDGNYTATVPTAAGTYFVKASVEATEDYNACEAKISFTISDKAIDSKDITFSGIDAYYLFTGSAITPKPIVKVDGTTLINGTDYDVSYENNTEIGTNAKVKVTLKGNYSGTAEKTFEIRFGAMDDTEIKNAITLPSFSSNDWYNKDIVINAVGEWTLCKTPIGSFVTSLTISDESTKTGTDYTFYIKAADGSVYERTLNYKLDKHNPADLKIRYNTNGFKSFLNTISFGLFFKETVTVTAQAIDELSGIAKYQYIASNIEITDFTSVNWQDSLSLTQNSKKLIYVKAIDIAGNESIINYEGVVVYTDSTQSTADISFTRTSTTDVTFKVNLNENTVKEIKNGDTVIPSSNYTVKADGTVTLKASYLDTLAVGSYTLTVSYNPLGESYVAGTNNAAPASTSLALSVKAKSMSDQSGVPVAAVEISPSSMVYTGSAFAPTVTVKDGTKKLAENTDYTLTFSTDMTSVGEKTVTVNFKGIYSGSLSRKVSVTNATITDNTNKTQTTTFNNTAQTVTAPTATTVNNQALTVKYSTDGVNYNLTSAPTFTNKSENIVYYQLSAPNHDVVTGQITFTVSAVTDNAITGLTIGNWTFGETAKTPSATAKYGAISYTYSDSESGDYTATVPIAQGTYFVKASVAATNDYNACEAKTSFTISDKAIDRKDIAISGIDAFYLFTGSEITPEPIVKVGETTLNKGTDYDVSYENNTEIGKTAKVKVTLKGNYSGAAEKTFEIRYGAMDDTEIKNAITLPDFNSNGWYNKDIVINAVGNWTLCKTPTGSFGTSLTISDESTKTGTDYTFYIKTADGSVYERTLNYKLDKVAPEGNIVIAKSGIENLLRTITFGLFFNSDVDVTVTNDDSLSGIAKVEVYKADKELTEQELTSVQWTAYTSSIQEKAKDAERFVYYARITDIAGNSVIINSDGVIFDTTAPVISGITNGETYYTSQKVTATDAEMDSIIINEKNFQNGSVISGNVNATYTVTATDKAGNITTYTVTMKPISDISDPMINIAEEDVKPEDQDKIEETKKKAQEIDTTNATAEEKKAVQDIIDKCDRLLKKIEANKNSTQSPQTGDTTNMGLWIALLFVSGGALTVFGVSKKRKKANSK